MDTKTETTKTKEVAKSTEITRVDTKIIKPSVASYNLETSKATEQAVLMLLKSYPNHSFARADITEILSHANLTPHAKECTKGGNKTGKGKPRWVKNIAWAIQTLSKKGLIKKLGKNAYGYKAEAKTEAKTEVKKANDKPSE